MVGAGKIVANGFGRMATKEYRARMTNASKHRFGISNRKLEMFGRQPVNERRSLAQIIDHDHRAVRFPTCTGHGLRRQGRQHDLDCGGDCVGKTGIIGDQDRLARRIMLGLRQQVGRNPFGAVRTVGDHQYLGRPGDHIDTDAAEELAFGFGDPGIAGADDHIDRRDRFGAVGEGCDSLRATDAPHFVDTRQRSSSQH